MRRYLLIAVKLAVSISLVAFLYRKTPLEEIGRLLAQIEVRYLLPIILLLFLNTVISARKWQCFLKADNLHLSLWDLTVSYMSGTFCNLFLPSNIGGDSYRIYDIARQSRQTARSAASVIADRLSGFVALVILSFVSSLAVAAAFGSWQLLVVPTLLLLLFIIIMVALVKQEPVRKILDAAGITRISAIQRVLEKLFASFTSYQQEQGVIVRVMLLSFLFQFSVITVVYLMARALGVTLPFYYFSAFVPIITLMEALPISIYGIGVRDYGYVYFFSQVGMGDLQTRSLALFFMATAVCYSLIGGLFFLYNLWSRKRRIELPRDHNGAV
ncbi:MAG: lysylphosphatidylglycerol synthase transmembrane domain-containing protein [Desulfofustis sp.]|jgi:uncharacterized protein (TIRG00374 family)